MDRFDVGIILFVFALAIVVGVFLFTVWAAYENVLESMSCEQIMEKIINSKVGVQTERYYEDKCLG